MKTLEQIKAEKNINVINGSLTSIQGGLGVVVTYENGIFYLEVVLSNSHGFAISIEIESLSWPSTSN